MNRTEYACTVVYDDQFDFLTLTRPDVKSSGSVIAGPFVIDFYRKELAGIEIEKATDLLESLFGAPMDLKKIKGARIAVTEKNNILMLYLAFEYENKEFAQQIVVPKTNAKPLMA